MQTKRSGKDDFIHKVTAHAANMCLHGELIGAEKRIEVPEARAGVQTKSTEHVYPREARLSSGQRQ